MYPSAYIEYLVHYHGDRDYFECHEILEEYWKEATDGSKDSIWVGLILLAVSNYHHRRQNFNGAFRTLNKAIEIITNNNQEIQKLGIDFNVFILQLSDIKTAIEHSKPYKSYQFPINDPKLLHECMNLIKQKGFTWGSTSDLMDQMLIHRHSTRDRSDVIEDRHKSLLEKKKQRDVTLN